MSTLPESRARWTAPLAALALVLAVVALYWPVRANGFVSYDDEVYLIQNPHVLKGLDAHEIAWVFTHEHAANYHPLTWVAHMLDVELFGLEPGPHHLVNVGLHALNAVLVLFLGRALLGSLGAGLLAAALFALHPLRVESVAWASERKDVLCATLFLATALLHLAYARAPSAARYALGLVACALALLAKPMAVTLPCVLLLLDVWPAGRLARGERVQRLVLEKLPHFALAFLGALSTWYAQEVGGAASGMVAVPLGMRVLNALASYGVYLFQTVWPAKLACFYPLAPLVEESPAAALLPAALVSAALLVVVSMLAWRLRVRAPWFAVAWCWFLGLLVPVVGLKQVGLQAHADRYTYLPLLGAVWCLCGAVLAGVRRQTRLRLPSTAAAGAAIVALCLATRTQLATWRDTPSLFEHALAVTEKNYVAHAALGAYQLERGDPETARAELQQALTIYPLEATALTSLGRLELEGGDPRAAEAFLQRAKQVHASKWARYYMGRVKDVLGNREAAVREFGAALELDPSLVDAHFNLGKVLYELERRDEAKASFERALALAPKHAGAHNGLGVLALDAGDLEGARAQFEQAVACDPTYADALHNLGVALERLGRGEEARLRYVEEERLRAGAGARKRE